MAKVHSNPIIAGTSGTLGKQLAVRRLADGRTILCARPDFSHRKLSPEQELHHRRFREASAYARYAAKTQPVYAERAAGTATRAMILDTRFAMRPDRVLHHRDAGYPAWTYREHAAADPPAARTARLKSSLASETSD